jgi:hypothetical protein
LSSSGRPPHLEECASTAEVDLTDAQLAEIERALPVGLAAGERFSEQQWMGNQPSRIHVRSSRRDG